MVKMTLFAVAVLLLLFLLVRFLEYKSLYFPLRTLEVTPEEEGLTYDDVSLLTGDGVRLHAWYVPAVDGRATVLFSHGNGGNISHRLEKVRILHDLGLHVLIYDYRGYGRSSGRPSEEGLYRDIDAMYDYLFGQRNISPQSIIAYGESLGGAVTIDLASRRELGGIVIEGSFTSVRDMAKRILPFVPPVVYKSSFDSLGKIGRVTCLKLFFHGRDDEIVPFQQGRRLFERAREPKKFVVLEGGHNDAYLASRDLYSRELAQMAEHLSGQVRTDP